MVPDSWIYTTFEKHIDLLSGFAFKSSNYSSNKSDVRLLRGDNIEPGSLRWRGVKRWPINEREQLQKYQLEEHDFVIAMDRTWIAAGLKVAEVKKYDLPCMLVQRVSRIRSLNSLEQSLLIQYFSSNRFEQYVKSVQTETAVPHISAKQIKEFPFLLPPLPEQKKIAKILSTWDKAISTTEALIDNSKLQKKSLMQQLLTGKKRFPGFWGKWEYIPLGYLTKIYDGTHSTPKYVGSGVPFYSVEHLTKNDFSSTKFITEEVYEKENKRVKLETNDILMTRIGDIGTAKCLTWDVKASYYVSLALIKSNPAFNSLYLTYFINSQEFHSELWKRTIHVAFPKKINLGEISNCLIKLPSIDEQQKIAKVLTNAEKEIALLKQQLADLKQEKKALMQQLLTGKRRVKVDEC